MENDYSHTIEWLRQTFTKSNHPKYMKYREEWLRNLTPQQLEGFERQRQCSIDKSKCL